MINNDPMGMGRVRVQFPWQEDKNQMTPWIRLIQPHSGAGKGFHFIPEIGEEVLVGFESGNAEKPFVMGTHYNGSETSGYGTSDNSIKAIHTRSGHILKFTEDESIILTDKSGNIMTFDTVGSNITITAPETMTLNCKNMNINVGENMTTSVGQNISTSAGNNISVTAGNDITETATGNRMEMSDNRTEIVQKDYTRQSDTSDIFAKRITAISSEEDILIQSAKTVHMNSGEKGTNH